MHSSPFSDDWRPSLDLGMVRVRANCLRAAREFFDRHDYLEVETPLLSHETVVDANLDPIVAEFRPGRSAPPQKLYLQTSPEFGMKRLLAAGAGAVYQITRAFRDGEAGTLHNPEFTMIEWYRPGDSYRDQMDVTEGLVRAIAASVPLAFDRREFSRLSYDEAFARAIGTSVLHRSARELSELCGQMRLVAPPGLAADDRDGFLNFLLAECVEPTLGRNHPEFVFDFPATQSALAVVRDDRSPAVAERFELYWQGIELCNGYQELTDPDELRRRMAVENQKRKRDGGETLPEENRLLEAMRAGLPECSGVALGLDRLLMLLAGKQSLSDAIAFPLDRA